MGRRGTKRTPLAELEARGSWRARGRKGEAAFSIQAPECPAWVPILGRNWFRQQAHAATVAGYMSQPFQLALAAGAFALAEFLELDRDIKKQGRTVVDGFGNPKSHPLIAQRNAAWDRMFKVCIEFGFTPAAKTNIKVGNTAPKEDSLEAFEQKFGS